MTREMERSDLDAKVPEGARGRPLFMPALVAIRRSPHVRAFRDQLVAADKKPMQAVVAVMHKLLHAIWAVWRYD